MVERVKKHYIEILFDLIKHMIKTIKVTNYCTLMGDVVAVINALETGDLPKAFNAFKNIDIVAKELKLGSYNPCHNKQRVI